LLCADCMIIVREVETFRGVDPHGGEDCIL
jgi:hypothetical protein